MVEDTGKCEAVMEERCGQVYRQYSMTQLCADVPRTVCHLQQRVTLQSQPRLTILENLQSLEILHIFELLSLQSPINCLHDRRKCQQLSTVQENRLEKEEESLNEDGEEQKEEEEEECHEELVVVTVQSPVETCSVSRQPRQVC